MKLTASIKLVIFCLLITNQSTAQVSSYGVGVGLNNGFKLYLPIKMENYFIEPTAFILSRSNKETGTTSLYESELDVIEIGVGLFKSTEVSSNTSIYYGSRLGYTETKDKYISSSSSDKEKQSGYFIAPTFGAEYHITNKFSIGIDVGYQYSKTDGKDTRVFNNTTTISDAEDKSHGTVTEVIVRYHF